MAFLIKLGSHISMSGRDMLLASAKEAALYGENTFMVYTGAPQNTRRKKIEDLNIEAGQQFMEENGIGDLIIHAPYIINLGNSIKPETFELAVTFLRSELERAGAMGSRVLVLHPGSHVGAGEKTGIQQIVKGINEVLTRETPVFLALETMAGKGGEIGRSFEDLAAIYDGVIFNDKLRVCFDTCHTHDAGYDIVNDFDGVIDEFDRTLGKNQICVFHLNDSKNPRGSAKDRHENIGFGFIGFDALHRILFHPDFMDIPKILETPFIPPQEGSDRKKAAPPYAHEIAMLKEGRFHPSLKEDILKNPLP